MRGGVIIGSNGRGDNREEMGNEECRRVKSKERVRENVSDNKGGGMGESKNGTHQKMSFIDDVKRLHG